jgi:hypothetical protein
MFLFYSFSALEVVYYPIQLPAEFKNNRNDKFKNSIVLESELLVSRVFAQSNI